jgi:hypothetical protein
MNYFWIKLAQWGHIPFLLVWIFFMQRWLFDATHNRILALVIGISFVILVLIKLIVHAPRPFLAKHLTSPFWVPKHDSFPSGHAWLLATGTILAIAIYGGSTWTIVLSALGILVSYSRFRSGVHRPREVWVGYVGGILVTIGAMIALGIPFV